MGFNKTLTAPESWGPAWPCCSLALSRDISCRAAANPDRLQEHSTFPVAHNPLEGQQLRDTECSGTGSRSLGTVRAWDHR